MSASDGYATAAAVVTSLAIGLVATAVTALSVGELKLARADINRTRAEYGLAGAQASAAATLAQSKADVRLAWTFGSDAGSATVLAEPEAAKVSFKVASSLDHATLRKLGASNPEMVRVRVGSLVRHGGLPSALSEADPSPLWRRCAASAISPLGQAEKVTIATAVAPQLSESSSHIGEVWRVKTTAGGWSDDRLVRFTGDVVHPAAVIERRFYRDGGGRSCDAISATK
jgi:hypothetical protein